MLNRRNKEAVSGYVNFPRDRLPSSGEGGIFVRLVVVPNAPASPEYPGAEFMQCCGGYNRALMDETLLGDDETAQIPAPVYPEKGDAAALKTWAEAEQAQAHSVIDKHFPGYYDHTPFQDEQDRYVSRQYLAVITLGSTGWSSGEWCCEYKDLTDQGKALYDQLAALYEGTGTLLLQTWLDT